MTALAETPTSQALASSPRRSTRLERREFLRSPSMPGSSYSSIRRRGRPCTVAFSGRAPTDSLRRCQSALGSYRNLPMYSTPTATHGVIHHSLDVFELAPRGAPRSFLDGRVLRSRSSRRATHSGGFSLFLIGRRRTPCTIALRTRPEISTKIVRSVYNARFEATPSGIVTVGDI